MKPAPEHLTIKSGSFSIERQHFAPLNRNKHDHVPSQDRKDENLSVNERLASMFLGGMLISSGIARPWRQKFIAGAYLTYRGLTGNCLFYERLGINSNKPHAINIRGEFEIDKSPTEVYSYWRNLNNLSASIRHLLDVEIVDETISHWKSNILGNMMPVDWKARIVKDEPGKLIGWRSAPGTLIGHVGRVQFNPSEDGTGTLLKIVLSYQPPGGGLGIGLARILNPYLEYLLKKEIKNFKHKVEYRPITA